MATREGELFVEKIDINLDGRQIFCLFCGGAVIASLVFVLGVTVGRRVEAREHRDPVASAAASDPLTALDQLAAEESAGASDLAFASTLRGEHEDDPLGPVDRSLDHAPPARLAARSAPLPVPRPEPTPPAQADDSQAEPESQPAPAARPDSEPTRRDAQAPPTEARPEIKPPVAGPEAAPETRPESPAPAAAAEVTVAAARFTLHLSSFQNRSEADALMARLKKRGYQPYLVESVEEGKGTWYRVRVGRYADFEAAVAGKTDFEKKQQIIAYVTRTKR